MIDKIKKWNKKQWLGIAVLVLFAMVLNKEDKEPEKVAETVAVQQYAIVNQWDGSVTEVKNYLRNNLNDWDSYESMEWSKVAPADGGGSFLVRHKYRAANGFGAKIIQHQVFQVSANGTILSVTDYE